MKKSRFTDAQMVKILRESDETSVDEAAKKHGVSTQSIYAWRKRFRGMSVDEVKRMKGLEAENAKLKKIVAEQVLAIDVLKEVNGKKW